MDGTAGLVSGYLGSAKIREFHALSSYSSKVAFLYSEEAFYTLIQGIRKSSMDASSKKDKAMAIALREEGNKAFGAGDDHTALDLYNQSIMVSPCDRDTGRGEDLAIALANRAAVLYRKEKYFHCLDDTSLAAASGYPKHLSYKLHQRRANCLVEIFRFTEAEKEFQAAVDALKDSKLGKEQKLKLAKDFTSQIDQAKKKHGLEKAVKDLMKDPGEAVPKEMRVPEPTITARTNRPALSEAVCVYYDDLQGRHLVATRDIRAGEVIAVESPVAHLLDAGQCLSNCTQCVVPVIIPVPCCGCMDVVYCSMKCRDASWSTFHRWECSLTTPYLGVYGDILFVYRLLCQKPPQFHRERKCLLGSHCVTAGSRRRQKPKCNLESDDEGDTDDSESTAAEQDAMRNGKENGHGNAEDDPYTSAFHLVTHDGDASDENRLSVAASATLIVYFLKKSGYFGGGDTSKRTSLTDDELLLASLACHFLRVQRFNRLPFAQIEHFDASKGIRTGDLGTAIYPTLSMLNHSCDANTARVNVGNGARAVIVASKNIRESSEVTASYSVSFHDRSASDRASFLQNRYRFTCRCVACVGNWPTQENIKRTVARNGMSGRVDDVKKMYVSATSMTQKDLQSGYFDRIVEIWASFCTTIEQILVPPHKCYLRVSANVHDAFWLKHGNRVPKLNAPYFKDHVIDAKVKKEEQEEEQRGN